MAEFSQPLVDAAGDDPETINRAFQLGIIFWNLGLASEHDGDEIIREQLSKMEKESCRTGGDTREFREIAVMMFDRYATMRPGARANLQRIIEGVWGRNLAAAAPKFGLIGRFAGAVKDLFTREARDGES